MHDLRLEDARQVLSVESLKCAFLVLVLLKVLSQTFLSLEFSFPYFCAFLACH